MKSCLLRPINVAAGALGLLLAMPLAQVSAATVGFTLEISPRPGFFDPNFGTGVSASDSFAGTIFFDSNDLTPDGARKRSILPGGDSLTIAGVSFDDLLDDTFWSFSFVGGEPACFDTGIGGGCGTGTAQINFFDANDPYPSISFTDDFLGTAFDADELSLGFNYSLTSIPVPAAFWLFGSALGLLGWVRRKRA